MISIVIPSYKNRELLVGNLEKNKKYFGDHEVIIVNDDPSESIKDDLAHFDNIVLIENGQNLGFAGAVNKGVRCASHDFVMILNSDVILQDKTFEKLVQQFELNKKLFAISFAQVEKNGSIVGRNALFWKNGFAQHSGISIIKAATNAWAEGGSLLIDKTKFDTLHGFSTLFSPFYWEDIDLSYRAWKKGYIIRFDPTVKVIHHHESTISKYFAKSRIKKIAYRNQLIFIWKNITDKELLSTHLVAILKQLIYSVVRFDWPFIVGYINALCKMPEILKQRSADSKHAVLTDKHVFELTNEK